MRVLITGASGTLGAYLLEAAASAGLECRAWCGRAATRRGGLTLEPIDLTDFPATIARLDAADPDGVLHAAAVASADAVRADETAARVVNVDSTRAIAEWCRRRGRRLIYTSTDLVFSGDRAWNRETDPAVPCLAYGRSKLDAEAAVWATPRGLVARLSLLYGPTRCERPAFFDGVLSAWRERRSRAFFEDEFRTPLDLETCARILVALARQESTGVVHVGGAERVSRYELMRRVATALGFDPALVIANRRSDVELPEPRPADVSLDTSRLVRLLPELHRPSIEEAVRRLCTFDN